MLSSGTNVRRLAYSQRLRVNCPSKSKCHNVSHLLWQPFVHAIFNLFIADRRLIWFTFDHLLTFLLPPSGITWFVFTSFYFLKISTSHFISLFLIRFIGTFDSISLALFLFVSNLLSAYIVISVLLFDHCMSWKSFKQDWNICRNPHQSAGIVMTGWGTLGLSDKKSHKSRSHLDVLR